MATKGRPSKTNSTNTFTLSTCGTYYDVLTASGYSFQIDASDYAYVCNYSWNVKSKSELYPVRTKRNDDTGYYTEYTQLYLAYDLMGYYRISRADKSTLTVNYIDGNSMNLRKGNLTQSNKQEVALRMVRNSDNQDKRRINLENREAELQRHLERVAVLTADHYARANCVGWAVLTQEDIASDNRFMKQMLRDGSGLTSRFTVAKSNRRGRFL